MNKENNIGIVGTVIVVFILFFLVTPQIIHAQIISLFAGSAMGLGDGGPATAAGLTIPTGIAIDATGNVFVNDYGNRIRKIDPSGIITTYAGTGIGGTTGDGGPATAAGISTGWGLTIDGAGNLYIASVYKIRKVDVSGIITTIAGTGVTGYSGDGGPATAAQFGTPTDIAFDNAGNMYISDAVNNCVRKVNSVGIISTYAGTGIAGYSGDGGPATAAQFNNIRSLAIDGVGNLYVGEDVNRCVRKIDAAGIVTTVAGDGTSGFSGDGGPATAAQLSGVTGVETNGGYIYISDRDYFNHRIRMVDPMGVITTIAGTGWIGFGGDGGPATAAELNTPCGIARYGGGNLYFCDRQNHRVRMITMPNSAPYFTHGSVANLTVCGEFNNIDTLLQVMDTNSAQPIAWTLIQPPAHGVAVTNYTTTSTGGILTPSGMSYMPYAGYAGPDTFKVRVYDGGAADTITIAVDVQQYPTAAPIAGKDTICVGDTAMLAGAAAGGIWSSSSPAVAGISGTGLCTGIMPGTAIITYTVTNFCGTDIATNTVWVFSEADCPVSVGHVAPEDVVKIFPNPNTGNFTLQLPHGENYVAIRDMTGRRVKEFMASHTTHVQMNVAAGVYFVEVVTGDVKWNGKIIVTP